MTPEAAATPADVTPAAPGNAADDEAISSSSSSEEDISTLNRLDGGEDYRSSDYSAPSSDGRTNSTSPSPKRRKEGVLEELDAVISQSPVDWAIAAAADAARIQAEAEELAVATIETAETDLTQ